MVLLHAVAGIVAFVLCLVVWLVRYFGIAEKENLVQLGMVFLFLGAILGLILIYTGTLRTEWRLVYVHLALSFAGAGIIAAVRLGDRGWLSRGTPLYALSPYSHSWPCSRLSLAISAKLAGPSMVASKILRCRPSHER